MLKDVIWVGSTQKDIKELPDTVRREFGFAIHQAQLGSRAIHATPMVGFGAASVLEVR